ncbi:hypothetical protein Fcan01_19083 [Folsomia candida]|uniref:Uncharacterized protein n=1 Tax=Folsomia candida TaxID=158441 RepID=A0A226DLG2_FOLCA|nr:hypothetical protein Fcan01_19083 [Folsomia candida]
MVTEGFTNLEYDADIRDFKFALDHHFLEKCSITIAFNVMVWQDWNKIRYISSKDTHRTEQFQNFLVINKSLKTSLSTNYDYKFPGKPFLVVVKGFKENPEVRLELEFYFYCVYCPGIGILRLPKSFNPALVNPSCFPWLFIKFWISASLPSMSVAEYENCKKQDWLRKLYYCEEDFKTVQYLIEATNLTFMFDRNLATAYANRYGYISLGPIDVGPYRVVNQLKFAFARGHSIFYCNFDKIGENTDLATWFQPFQGFIWLWLIFSVILSYFLFAAFRERKNSNVCKLMGRFVLLFKEPVKSPLTLNVMLIVLLQLLAVHYEYFFTSRLIVPPHFKELLTLKEFFENKFILLYDIPAKRDSDLRPWNFFILEDFKIQGIPREQFKSFKIVEQMLTLDDISKYISPEGHRKKIGFYRNSNYQENLRVAMETTYNNLYKCYIAKDVGEIRWFYFVIQTVLAEKIVRPLNNLGEFGIYNGWIKWFEQTHQYRLLVGLNNTGPKAQDFITFNNLSKFFILYCSMLATFLLVFVVDKICKIFSVKQKILIERPQFINVRTM